ncbi:MAG TPA: F0F1 ATP synthase subunit epsilon [Thermomicrobiales bacterium]|nr:F0F1 ATP synthase subunit epsilon [Thermomicrobiales bacterium]
MAANPKLQVEIVTGERVVYQESDVDMVIAPGADGELGILPRHAALFSLLSAGEMVVRKGTSEQHLAVFGGFLEVANDRVLILADTAERVEEIDEERAERARQRAEQALREAASQMEIEAALASLRRARVRTRLARRRRGPRADVSRPPS